jgi:hypothetical protein
MGRMHIGSLACFVEASCRSFFLLPSFFAGEGGASLFVLLLQQLPQLQEVPLFASLECIRLLSHALPSWLFFLELAANVLTAVR